jgi:hypothetical protein
MTNYGTFDTCTWSWLYSWGDDDAREIWGLIGDDLRTFIPHINGSAAKDEMDLVDMLENRVITYLLMLSQKPKNPAAPNLARNLVS